MGFIEVENNQLQRIDLAEADLNVGLTQRGGERKFTIDIISLSLSSRRIDFEIVEFEHRNSLEHFMGSAFGEWYSDFRLIQESSQDLV